jgi:hypothetical protein
MKKETETLLPVGSDALVLPLPEAIYAVDLKSWKFRRAYLAECLKYPFHFFRAAPVSHWHKFFRSTHRVACSCAVAACALENSGNMWEENSLRSRLKDWGKSRQNRSIRSMSWTDIREG